MKQVKTGAFGVFVFVAMAAANDSVAWRRWELEVPASTEAQKTSVRFTGPGGQVIESPVVMESEGKLKARIAFPSPGSWTWESNDKRGRIQVAAYEGSNPLFRHGFLKVHPSGRYLEHADGVPFLWMGDTAWYGGIKATDQEWRDYVADRVRKRFSVVQISATRVPAAGAPLEPLTEDGRPNPAYWKIIDERVKYANQQGLLVLMVGLGRPVRPELDALVARPEYARYVAGRFFGDHVVLSPNFDGEYKPLFDTVAENLRAATRIHLITQHPNTRKGQNEIYGPKAYLDFHGLQSGHHNGRLEMTYGAAREWPLALWALKPVRPVINIEGMYDGRGSNEGNGWREKDVRKIGWISWLSGALGYTYGAGETGRKVPGSNGGIWGWNQGDGDWDHWRKAAAWKSSEQMTVMRDFFAALPWWRLEPAHQVVLNGASDNVERPVFASTTDRTIAVAYTPVQQKLVLDTGWFRRAVRATWVHPESGRRIPYQKTIQARGHQEFVPPEPGDDWTILFEVVK